MQCAARGEFRSKQESINHPTSEQANYDGVNTWKAGFVLLLQALEQ
jgi:hypothetical protein